MSDINHSHPLVMQITDLQAVLTNTNRLVKPQSSCIDECGNFVRAGLVYNNKSQFNLVPSDLVDAVFAAHAEQQDAGERRKVQLRLHRYAQCTLSNMLQGV